MAKFFDNRKKQKLYRQWVEKSGLPPESVPGYLEQPDDPDATMDRDFEMRRPESRGGFTFHLTFRHLAYLVLTVAVLLITTATLATILIMRSC